MKNLNSSLPAFVPGRSNILNPQHILYRLYYLLLLCPTPRLLEVRTSLQVFLVAQCDGHADPVQCTCRS